MEVLLPEHDSCILLKSVVLPENRLFEETLLGQKKKVNR